MVGVTEGRGEDEAHGPAAADDADVDGATEAWRLLVEVFLSQRDRFLAVAQSMGITPVHAHALKMLQSIDAPSMRGLAEVLQCDASNVTAIVDRLESRGLVERRASPTDRRVKTLVLTGAGLAAADRIERAMFEPPPVIRELGPSEVEALRKIAARLAQSLRSAALDRGSPTSGPRPASRPPR